MLARVFSLTTLKGLAIDLPKATLSIGWNLAKFAVRNPFTTLLLLSHPADAALRRAQHEASGLVNRPFRVDLSHLDFSQLDPPKGLLQALKRHEERENESKSYTLPLLGAAACAGLSGYLIYSKCAQTDAAESEEKQASKKVEHSPKKKAPKKRLTNNREPRLTPAPPEPKENKRIPKEKTQSRLEKYQEIKEKIKTRQQLRSSAKTLKKLQHQQKRAEQKNHPFKTEAKQRQRQAIIF